jgi:hypothetical protein
MAIRLFLIQPQDNKPCSKAKKIAILAGQLFKNSRKTISENEM